MRKFYLITMLLLISVVTEAQIEKPSMSIKRPRGKISFTSTPAGCSVSIDEIPLEGKVTPFSLEKAEGSYNITFSHKDYISQSKSVRVTSGKTTKCYVKMSAKTISPRDSITLIANEIIAMNNSYDYSTLNSEEKDIASFQANAINYAKGVKELYESMIKKEDASKLSIDELKVIITNSVLRNQQCSNLESPCIQSAMKMFQNMADAKSNVYQGVNVVELAKLAEIVQKQALTSEYTAKVVDLIGQIKLIEALDFYQQRLLDPEIIERYNSFLSVLKGFFTLSNMRLAEIKNQKDTK